MVQTIESPIRFGNYQGAESVEKAHPDAMMDDVAGANLDKLIDTSFQEAGVPPRVAIEGAVKGHNPDEGKTDNFPNGVIMLVGEVSLPQGVVIDYEQTTRDAIREIGYTDPLRGFSADTVEILTKITRQSADIDHGVSRDGKELGAGDQGITVGAAIAGDGPEYMPTAVMVAHGLTGRLTEVKKLNITDGLRPDGKAQVVLQYHNGSITRVHSVTIATAHDPQLELPQLREAILRDVILPVFDRFNLPLSPDTQIIINGAGEWNNNGPSADAAEVGRKLAIAYLAALYPIGGGTPFGKDPTKVDLTGALIARLASRFVVENGLAREAITTIYWTIGQPVPDGVNLQTFDRRRGVSQKEIERLVQQYIAFSVSGAIEQMNLWHIKYEPLAAGGIFGRPEYPWEQPPRI